MDRGQAIQVFHHTYIDKVCGDEVHDKYSPFSVIFTLFISAGTDYLLSYRHMAVNISRPMDCPLVGMVRQITHVVRHDDGMKNSVTGLSIFCHEACINSVHRGLHCTFRFNHGFYIRFIMTVVSVGMSKLEQGRMLNVLICNYIVLALLFWRDYHSIYIITA